ncbi:hypothetical protein LXA43DRAFT_969611 [Ganoderma leucocontextum]|nr:hypothetical protein LXA43DRAFT_969611 [Ganoderma leucocontextum]
MHPASDDSAAVHGLSYPPSFLDSLPHLTAHAPDHVLFPFLHGLEGDNEQQNAFFSSSRSKGDVPSFRGLIWVACDEDEEAMCDAEDLEEDDDDDYSTSSSLESFEPADLEDDVAMELDPTVEGPMVNGCPPPDPLKKVPLAPSPVPLTSTAPAFLTSSFRVRELLRTRAGEAGTHVNAFVEPRIPDGISLRNFGIQVVIGNVAHSPLQPIYATLSDIVVYSPRGHTRHAITVAEKFKQAIELKYAERRSRAPTPDALVTYNVFVLDASPSEMVEKLPHLVVRTEDLFSGAHTDGTDAHTLGELRTTSPAFSREKEEMRDLTQASEIVSIVYPASTVDPDSLAGSSTSSHWEPTIGQIFLGNSNDVPLPPDRRIRMRTIRGDDDDDDAYDWRSNDPNHGYGYDLCIECHDYAPFPTSAHLRAAEEHVRLLEKRWIERCVADMDSLDPKDAVQPRPPPNASHVVHLPFPSSPASSVVTINTLLPFIHFLKGLMQPVDGSLTYEVARDQLFPPRPQNAFDAPIRRSSPTSGFSPSSLPPPSTFPTSFFQSSPSPLHGAYTRIRSTSATFPSTSSPATPSINPVPLRTRPLKILVYSADGYTESSVLALCILMALRGSSLPEAYLTLQVEKRRSFFVYQSDLGVLRRVEARLEKDRPVQTQSHAPTPHPSPAPGNWSRSFGHASARSVQFANSPVANDPSDIATGVSAPSAVVHPLRTRSESEADVGAHPHTPVRPRAKTLPPTRTLPWKDHQVWFNDPRFDGSFPSRVLPFLYLGNLNHASNAFMLHALGITHVVSVGECALVPPPHLNISHAGPPGACAMPNHNAHFVLGKGPGGQGSLWIEEREGRIKVLDIKGVCDDGIDTLEPQLEPICEWIDKAREEGGKVLVHCRVGVSRSATVTIAYVMKHLGIPLVDAYLIVRSRRLSVLIQPNMRLLYNLLGWEIKLARERCERALVGQGGECDEWTNNARMQHELPRALNWPYLAKEVHALNEKYLH